MTKDDKMKIALYYIKEHCSIFQPRFDGHITLGMLESFIKSDRSSPKICDCDTCCHDKDYSKVCEGCWHQDSQQHIKWHFSYAYWKKIYQIRSGGLNG